MEEGFDTMLHREDVSSYPHFRDIDMLYFPKNYLFASLIGNDNVFLITALEELERDNVKDPHAFLSKIGCVLVSPWRIKPQIIYSCFVYFDFSAQCVFVVEFSKVMICLNLHEVFTLCFRHSLFILRKHRFVV